MNIFKLNSVGCVIDKNGITYSMYADGGYDIDSGCHVNDIENDEFFKALNRGELSIVEEYYRSPNGTYKEIKPK